MGYIIQGKEVGGIGFGLLGLTWRRDAAISDEDAIAAMKTALDAGCNYWNAGEFYGPPDNNSMVLMRQYFERYPEDVDKILVNVKGCVAGILQPDSSPEGVKRSIENCLNRLGGRGRIDQFEPGRKDPKVPIEATVDAIDGFVRAGKVGGVALSEVSAETIRRAAKVAKITAVEIELSLWSTEPLTNGVVQACAELNIPIIAYSPLGRGFLAGKIQTFEDIPNTEYAKLLPRFHRENFDTNIKLVQQVEKLAQKKGCTTAQIAINWIVTLAKRPGMPPIIPIPGSTNIERIKENAKVIPMTDEEMKQLDDIIAACPIVGDRYHSQGMAMLDK